MQVTDQTSKRPVELLQKAMWFQAVLMLLSIVITLVILAYLGPKVQDLNNQRNALTRDIKLLNTNMNLLNIEKAKLEEQSKNIQRTIKELTKQRDNLMADKQRLNNEITETRRQLQAATMQLSEAKKALNTLPITVAKQALDKSATQDLPIIYVHIGDEAQRQPAQELVQALKKRNYVVPGIENIASKARSPKETELRHNSKADLSVVNSIKEVMRKQFSLRVKSYAPKYKKFMPRINVFEIWLSNDDFK